MKHIKLFFALALMAFVVTSCAKEEVLTPPGTDFPSENNSESSRYLDPAGILFGQVTVQGPNSDPTTSFLGDTRIQWVTGNDPHTFSNWTSTLVGNSPNQEQSNFNIPNTPNIGLCFHHLGVLDGIYTWGEWKQGVNQYDVVRVLDHINGSDPFTHFWQYLAADVNGSGTITQADIVILNDLIAGAANGGRDDLPSMKSGKYNQPVLFYPQNSYDFIEKGVSQSNFASLLPFYKNFYYGVLTCGNNIQHLDTDRYAIKRGNLVGPGIAGDGSNASPKPQSK